MTKSGSISYKNSKIKSVADEIILSTLSGNLGISLNILEKTESFMPVGKEFGIPVLITTTEHDKSYQREVAFKLQRIFLNSKRVEIKDSDHNYLVFEPEKLVGSIEDFLIS